MKEELFRTYRNYVPNLDNISGIIAFANLMEQGYQADLNKKISSDNEAAQLILSTNKDIMLSSAENRLNQYNTQIVQNVSYKMHEGVLKDYSQTLDAFKKTQEQLDGCKWVNIKISFLSGVLASLIAAGICLGIHNGVIKKGKLQEAEMKIEELEKENKDLHQQLNARFPITTNE